VVATYTVIFQRLLFAAQAQHRLEVHEVKGKLKDLINEIDAIRERLEIDSNHQPLRLIGLKISYQLLNQIYTMLLTLVAAVLQRMMFSGASMVN
jgi:hypothetical protein